MNYKKNFSPISFNLQIYLITACFLMCMVCTSAVWSSEVLDEEMILIPAGEFTVGGNVEDSLVTVDPSVKTSADPANKLKPLPKKKVFLKGFYISKYETTNAQYKRFIDDGGYRKSKYWSKEGWEFITKNNITLPNYWEDGENNNGTDYRNYPVVGVSWYEANAYAKWADKRLLSEVEWEKAARGTDDRLYPWGDEFDQLKCNSSENGLGMSTPIGSFLSGTSPYGIMDMCGNVYVWVLETVPVKGGRDGILRGGSWGYNASEVQTISRYHRSVESRTEGEYTGIRLASDDEQ